MEDTVRLTQPECTVGKLSPLHFNFLRMKFINSSAITAECIYTILIMFLLVDTKLGCAGATIFFQKYIALSQSLSQMIWQFVSASLTDSTEKKASTVLLITLISQITLDAILYLQPFITVWFGGIFGISNQWFILTIFVIRFAIVQQITNSVLKIFKMRIQLVMNMPVDQQLASFNNISITSDFMGRFSSLLFGYITFIALINTGFLTFEMAKNIFFICVAVWDIISLICCATLTKSYYLVEEEKAFNIDEEDLEILSIHGESFLEELVPVDELDDLAEFMEENEMDDLDDPEVNEKFVLLRFLIYFKRSFFHYVKNRILLCISIHLWSVVIVLSFVLIVLRFAVTDPGEDKGNRGNFCNGQILNLVENQLYVEISKIAGAIIFQLYMTKLKPKHYFRYIFFILCVMMAGLCAFNFLDLGPSAGSVSLALINVVIFLGMIYDMNMNGSIAKPEIVGFVYGIQGTVLQLLALTPVGVVYLIEKGILTQKIVVGVCVALSCWAGIFGLFISIKYGNALEVLFKDEEEKKKSKCNRCLFGS